MWLLVMQILSRIWVNNLVEILRQNIGDLMYCLSTEIKYQA